MLIVVDPHSGVPVYRQIMDQVKFLVASGRLRAEAELPSTRALSAALGVNPMTISKAYSYLEREGVIVRRPGRPLVVRPIQEEEVRNRRRERLREILAPSATAVHQLGITAAEATTLFRELLEEQARSGKATGEGATKGGATKEGTAGTGATEERKKGR